MSGIIFLLLIIAAGVYGFIKMCKPNIQILPRGTVIAQSKQTITQGVITYSDWYVIELCPNCKRVIKDERKARYDDRCCIKCGHKNGYLFTTSTAVVRDVFKDGKFVETVLK